MAKVSLRPRSISLIIDRRPFCVNISTFASPIIKISALDSSVITSVLRPSSANERMARSRAIDTGRLPRMSNISFTVCGFSLGKIAKVSPSNRTETILASFSASPTALNSLTRLFCKLSFSLTAGLRSLE